MSSLDVLYLRKQGKWQEALDLALYNINACDSEYSRMALFWVIYDICRMARKVEGTKDIIIKCLVYMRALQRNMIDDKGIGRDNYQRLLHRYMINESRIDMAFKESLKSPVRAYNFLERMNIVPQQIHPAFHDSYGWIICRYLQRQGLKVSARRVKKLLVEYFQLQTSRPSKLHSMILDVVLNFILLRPNESFDFNRFFSMWGPTNLRWQDNYSFTTQGRSHSPIFPRLLKVLEQYTDSIGIASITKDLPIWRWEMAFEQMKRDKKNEEV